MLGSYSDRPPGGPEARLSNLPYVTPIALPVRKMGFPAGLRPDSNRESLKMGPPAGLRPAGGPIVRFSRRPKSGPEARFPSRKHYCLAQGRALYPSCTLPHPLSPGGGERERGQHKCKLTLQAKASRTPNASHEKTTGNRRTELKDPRRPRCVLSLPGSAK